MAELKLIALDADDLAVLSAHLQDAVIQVGDIAYLPQRAAVCRRWATASTGSTRSRTAGRGRTMPAGARPMRFERVLGAQGAGHRSRRTRARCSPCSPSASSRAEAPEGNVTLHFADGGAIRLHVECIEAELKDLGPVWRVEFKPQHPDDDPRQRLDDRTADRHRAGRDAPMPVDLDTTDPDFESAFAAFLADQARGLARTWTQPSAPSSPQVRARRRRGADRADAAASTASISPRPASA